MHIAIKYFNMHGQYIQRRLHSEIIACLKDFPAVAILGPRQCGKTTLAKAIISELGNTVYLDLERPSDSRKLSDPELFLSHFHDKMICLDEIQRIPELFQVLRSEIDSDRKNGRFLILGSASPELIKQSSESLAGRIAYLELTPFQHDEIPNPEQSEQLMTFWVRGGFPDSFFPLSEESSMRWRENFVRTFLERDMGQLGIRIPAETLRRVWQMCAYNTGQVFNASRLGASIGVSHTTMKKYIDLLAGTYMLRILQPHVPNIGKRLVKSPKVYLRDTGILHWLMNIDCSETLLGHPSLGPSWETLVIENMVSAWSGWTPHYYRTANGAEIDLLLIKGNRKLAIECKASTAPKVSKGFWNAIEDLRVEHAWVVAPISGAYPISNNVTVTSLNALIKKR